ncbi:MAG TPA: hypothetical protein VHW93_07255, partial [Acidimicrobiales bacterium]|nr:hypothetical protein [Acidimicrobiales bacterium]
MAHAPKGASAALNAVADAVVSDRSVPAPERPSNRGIAPVLLAYVMSPVAFGIVIVLRDLGYVARLSIWAYLAALIIAPISSLLVEPWRDARARSVRMHVR